MTLLGGCRILAKYTNALIASVPNVPLYLLKYTSRRLFCTFIVRRVPFNTAFKLSTLTSSSIKQCAYFLP